MPFTKLVTSIYMYNFIGIDMKISWKDPSRTSELTSFVTWQVKLGKKLSSKTRGGRCRSVRHRKIFSSYCSLDSRVNFRGINPTRPNAATLRPFKDRWKTHFEEKRKSILFPKSRLRTWEIGRVAVKYRGSKPISWDIYSLSVTSLTQDPIYKYTRHYF